MPQEWQSRCSNSRLPNVWLGVSVENQAAADERIPLLLQTPAAVRFLSCEPLLGAVDLAAYLPAFSAYYSATKDTPELRSAMQAVGLAVAKQYGPPRVGWVIVGGESAGPEERRLVTHLGNRNTGEIWTPSQEALGWVRAIKQQCLDAEIPLFLKQWGGPKPTSGGRLLDGRTWDEFPDDQGAESAAWRTRKVE